MCVCVHVMVPGRLDGSVLVRAAITVRRYQPRTFEHKSPPCRPLHVPGGPLDNTTLVVVVELVAYKFALLDRSRITVDVTNIGLLIIAVASAVWTLLAKFAGRSTTQSFRRYQVRPLKDKAATDNTYDLGALPGRESLFT